MSIIMTTNIIMSMSTSIITTMSMSIIMSTTMNMSMARTAPAAVMTMTTSMDIIMPMMYLQAGAGRHLTNTRKRVLRTF